MENLDDEDPDYAIPGPSNAIQNFNEETGIFFIINYSIVLIFFIYK